MINNLNIYYSILGVTEKASIETIKSQYRKLCKLYHPDISDFKSIEKISLINEAYSVIINKNESINKNEVINTTCSNSNVNLIIHKNQEYVYYKKGIEYFRKADINMAFRGTNAWNKEEKSFDYQKALTDLKQNIYKSLYYFNYICINYKKCEWYLDSVKKISELNNKIKMIEIWESEHIN